MQLGHGFSFFQAPVIAFIDIVNSDLFKSKNIKNNTSSFKSIILFLFTLSYVAYICSIF